MTIRSGTFIACKYVSTSCKTQEFKNSTALSSENLTI